MLLPKIESIAMLPLKKLSGDAEEEYFVDGMSEALITGLGKISVLGVSSVYSLREGNRRAGGRGSTGSGVDGLGEGSVRRQSRPNQSATGHRGA